MFNQKEEVLVLAGEVSGDIHGAGLIREIKFRKPQMTFFGIGGDRMVDAGLEAIYHVKDMSFLGFFEVIKHLPFIRKVFNHLIKLLDTRKPQLVILIDYPGLNLRFAKKAKKQGFRVIYYISPQVWAWGKKRIKNIVKWVDRMLVIFPFEEELYQREGMDVCFVGHPLKELVQKKNSKEQFFKRLKLDSENVTIGILPGSRNQEIVHHLPEMVKAFKILKRKVNHIQAIVGIAPILDRKIYESHVMGCESLSIVKGETYEVMAHSDVVIVASGTATLETAILGTPMVVVYKVAPFSYLIGRLIVKVKYIAMVNIVAGKPVVPELLQKNVHGGRIADEVYQIISDMRKQRIMKKHLMEVSKSLGPAGASKRAARAVIEFMEQ